MAKKLIIDNTYVDFGIDNIDIGTDDNDEIEYVPCVGKVVFEAKCKQFENHFNGENAGEEKIENVHRF